MKKVIYLVLIYFWPSKLIDIRTNLNRPRSRGG